MVKIWTFIKRYLYNLWIGIDQLLNCLMAGDPDETVSGRMGRAFPNSWFRKLLDKILGEGHCKQAIESDEGKDDLIK